MAHMGELLRSVRLKLGFTLRDATERTQAVARVLGNPSLAVTYGYLGKVERGVHSLSVEKFFGLTESYSKSADEMLQVYKSQVHVPSATDPIGGPNLTQLITEGRLHERAAVVLPYNICSIPAPSKTAILPPDEHSLKGCLRVIIGSIDHMLPKFYPPGTIFHIDKHRKAIAVPREWDDEFDRPVYLLYTRDGYLCAWCEMNGSWLTAVPAPSSKTPHKHLRYGQEAEVVGRAVAVAKSLVSSKNA